MRPKGCTCRENPLTCKGAIAEREAEEKEKALLETVKRRREAKGNKDGETKEKSEEDEAKTTPEK